MLLVRTEHLDRLKIEKAAQVFEMSARLPSAAEQSQDLRPGRSQILRTDGTQRSDSHFLNDTVRHDRDRLNALDVEQDHETAVSVARSNRQDAPPLDARGK